VGQRDERTPLQMRCARYAVPDVQSVRSAQHVFANCHLLAACSHCRRRGHPRCRRLGDPQQQPRQKQGHPQDEKYCRETTHKSAVTRRTLVQATTCGPQDVAGGHRQRFTIQYPHGGKGAERPCLRALAHEGEQRRRWCCDGLNFRVSALTLRSLPLPV